MRTDRETAGLRGPVKTCSTEHDIAYPDHHWISYTDDTFSPEGNLLEKKQRNPDGSRWSIVCHYDEQGRLLDKMHSGDVQGIEVDGFSYHYDATGRPERVMRRSEKDGERLFESFQYAAEWDKKTIQLSDSSTAECWSHVRMHAAFLEGYGGHDDALRWRWPSSDQGPL